MNTISPGPNPIEDGNLTDVTPAPAALPGKIGPAVCRFMPAPAAESVFYRWLFDAVGGVASNNDRIGESLPGLPGCPGKKTMKTAVSFSNVSASIAQILGAVNTIVDTDTPVIVSAIPGGVSSSVSGDIALGELGLALTTQIISVLSALHTGNVAAAAASAKK